MATKTNDVDAGTSCWQNRMNLHADDGGQKTTGSPISDSSWVSANGMTTMDRSRSAAAREMTK